MILGQPGMLQFEITFSDRAKALGLGALRAFLGSTDIWANETGRGISWTWIELLEQLARSWPFLKDEESTSYGAYECTWSEEEPDTQCEREVYVFRRRHNLATGIEGLYVPSLTFLKEGRMMWVISRPVTRLLDFQTTLETLAQLGDALADHVEPEQQDERARMAAAAWL